MCSSTYTTHCTKTSHESIRSEQRHGQLGNQGPARQRRHRRRAEGDPEGRRPDHQGGRDPRDHGSERLGQVNACVLHRRSPEVQDHLRHGHARRCRRAGDEGRRAGPGRLVPRDAVPGRGAGRVGVELPAYRQDRHRRRGAQAAHLGQGRRHGHGAREDGHRLCDPQCERGLLRWREEAPRDRPARAAQPDVRDPRRDRLRPRHRCPQDRRRGREPVPCPGGPRRPADHALHPDPALHHARLRARVRERSDRRRGWRRARRAARGRGLRQVRQGRCVCLMSLQPSVSERTTDRALAGLLDGLGLIRADFPILTRTLADGFPLVYLDSANTSQKPQVVIDAMVDHLERHNSNVARAMHQLGAESSAAFEEARDKVAAFINAPSRDEVIFTKNASEALNLVANVLAWARGDLAVAEGDEVVITEMEHHSNIVPSQLLTERKAATLRWFGLTDEGHLDLSNIDDLITERTKVVSLTWVSNMLGTVNPIGEIARRAHEVGAVVVVDASQAAPQMPIDVGSMDADCRPDFLAFTGHKVTGPTGIGVLWGRRELLERLPPFLGGGEMIATVAMKMSTYADIPHRFEAGTPPIVEAVGLGAAVDYLSAIGMANVKAHEEAITGYALKGLASVNGLTVIGPTDAANRGGAISFEMDGIHPHDVSQVLDSRGIAVRAGHHLSLIHISEPTRRTPISYAVFC